MVFDEYDATGTLRRVVLPSDDVVEYVVDGADRRIARIANGTVSHRWLWGRAGVTAEVDATGAVTARYVYGLSHTPAYILRDGKRYALITDRRGSPILVVDVDATGPAAVVQRRTYDEWGCITSETGLTDLHPFGFAGGLYDPATGLTQFGAREYDCRVGRWTSLDPISFGDGGNRYAYVGADPINRIDLNGLLWGWINDRAYWLDTQFSKYGVGDVAAGVGDKVSLGLTDTVRDALDINDVVDKCSAAYRAGQFVGEVVRDTLIGHGALKFAKFALRNRIFMRIRAPGVPKQVRPNGSVHHLLDEGATLVVSENHLKHVVHAFRQYGGRRNLLRMSFWKHVLPHRHVYRLGTAPALNANWRKTFQKLNAAKDTIWRWQ